MKTWHLVLAILLSAHAYSMTPVEADSLVSQAARTYADGDPATALLLYDSVASTFASAPLFYNIGNCHFKLNDIPHAILFYERALLLSPGDADIKANLELARQQVVDRVNELPLFTLGSSWSAMRGGRDPDQWARRALWACLITFVVLALAFLIRQRIIRRMLFVGSAIFFLTTLLSIAFAAYRHSEVVNRSAAIIMAPKVDARSEPRTEGTKLFVLHKGTKVTVLKEEDGWSEVQLANGTVGWMPPSTLERI